MTDYKADNEDLLNSCMEIINAETKPIKSKPVKSAIAVMAIDIKREDMTIARLSKATPASELEELYKSI